MALAPAQQRTRRPRPRPQQQRPRPHAHSTRLVRRPCPAGSVPTPQPPWPAQRVASPRFGMRHTQTPDVHNLRLAVNSPAPSLAALASAQPPRGAARTTTNTTPHTARTQRPHTHAPCPSLAPRSSVIVARASQLCESRPTVTKTDICPFGCESVNTDSHRGIQTRACPRQAAAQSLQRATPPWDHPRHRSQSVLVSACAVPRPTPRAPSPRWR